MFLSDDYKVLVAYRISWPFDANPVSARWRQQQGGPAQVVWTTRLLAAVVTAKISVMLPRCLVLSRSETG
jgi:hypothetical protein